MTNSYSDRKLETIRLETSDQPKNGTRIFVHDNTENGKKITLSTSGTHDLRPTNIASSQIYDSGLKYLPNSQVLEAVLPNVGAIISRDDRGHESRQGCSTGHWEKSKTRERGRWFSAS